MFDFDPEQKVTGFNNYSDFFLLLQIIIGKVFMTSR